MADPLMATGPKPTLEVRSILRKSKTRKRTSLGENPCNVMYETPTKRRCAGDHGGAPLWTSILSDIDQDSRRVTFSPFVEKQKGKPKRDDNEVEGVSSSSTTTDLSSLKEKEETARRERLMRLRYEYARCEKEPFGRFENTLRQWWSTLWEKKPVVKASSPPHAVQETNTRGVVIPDFTSADEAYISYHNQRINAAFLERAEQKSSLTAPSMTSTAPLDMQMKFEGSFRALMQEAQPPQPLIPSSRSADLQELIEELPGIRSRALNTSTAATKK
jgi:hypothetical protein